MQQFAKIWTLFEEFTITFIFWILVILNFLNVATRYFIPQYGIAFTEDLSMLLFLWLIFFSAAACYTDDSHLGLPLFYDKLSPRVKMVVTTLVLFISIFMYVMVIYATGQLALNQLNRNVVTGMGFPAVIGGAALPLGTIAIIGRLIQSYLRNMRCLRQEQKNLAATGEYDAA